MGPELPHLQCSVPNKSLFMQLLTELHSELMLLSDQGDSLATTYCLTFAHTYVFYFTFSFPQRVEYNGIAHDYQATIKQYVEKLRFAMVR